MAVSARLYRTRPLAKPPGGGGSVQLSRLRVDKPGHALKPGDILTLGKGAGAGRARLALAERRDPAGRRGSFMK